MKVPVLAATPGRLAHGDGRCGAAIAGASLLTCGAPVAHGSVACFELLADARIVFREGCESLPSVASAIAAAPDGALVAVAMGDGGGAGADYSVGLYRAFPPALSPSPSTARSCKSPPVLLSS